MGFSSSYIAIYGIFLLVVSRISYKIYAKRARAAEAARRGCLPAPKLPPKGFLGIGRLRESMRATKEERGPQYVAETMDDVGVNTLAVPILDYELLVTRDPENVKAIMSSGDFDISATRQKSWWPLMGRGVFTARGQDWKHSRGLVRPQFARDQVQDVKFFEPHIKALLRKLTYHDSEGWTGKVDLSPLFYNLTIDNITEFLYGQSVHTQDPEARARLPISWDKNGPDLVNFGHHIDACKEYIDRKGALAKYQWLMSSNEFNNHCQEVQKFVDYFVRQKLSRDNADDEKTIETTTSGGKPRFVLLDELAKETQDATTLRSETLHIMIAGRDTSAALLGWVFYFLARNPTAFTRLRADAVGRYGSQPSDRLTFSSLWSFAYLHHVVNESLRVAAVIPMNERSALRDTALPRGGGEDGRAPIFVPRGNQVLIPLYAMQHRKDIWGEDVEEWNPERWNDRKFGWEFIPFGGGSRQCLGQRFGRAQVMYTIVRLLQEFDGLENLEAPGPIRFHHSIENRSGTGVQVRLHVASSGLSEKAGKLEVLNLGMGAERNEPVGEELGDMGGY